MFRNPSEIKVIEHWRDIWWDRRTDAEFLGSPTGTVTSYLELRRAQNIYGRIAHIPDDGELEILTEDSCGEYQIRLRCLACGKEFCADV